MTTHRSPDGIWATGGAVAQHDGKLPIYVCDDCGRDVVWATSKRTGRKYLVTVSRGYLDQRFYMGQNVHRCDRSRTPEARLAREILDDEIAAEAYLIDQGWKALDAARDAGDADAIVEATKQIESVLDQSTTGVYRGLEGSMR